MVINNGLAFHGKIFHIYLVLSSEFTDCVEFAYFQLQQNCRLLSMAFNSFHLDETCLHEKPTIMCSPISESANRGHLRSAVRGDLAVPRSRTTRYAQRCFAVSGPTHWNSLPLSVRDPSLSLTQFCARLKTVLFCRAYGTPA